MPVLKYRDPNSGTYVPLSGVEEVTVSASQPPTNTDLWVDTADNRGASTAPLSGWRNAMRNGDMSIAQRGNGPFTSIQYTADNWIFVFSGGTVSQSRVIQAPGLGAPQLSLAVSGQALAAHYAAYYPIIEDVSTFAGEQITISFNARAASGTPKIAIELEQAFGSGGSPSAAVMTPVTAVTISTTMQRYSVTTMVPSIVGKTLGTDGATWLAPYFYVSAGSNWAARASGIGIQNNTFYLTDVQVEAGTVATPFERLPVQQQLAWCQRYFQRLSVPVLKGIVSPGANMVWRAGGLISPSMRRAPTVAITGSIKMMDGSVDANVSVGNSYCTASAMDFDFNLSANLNAYRPASTSQGAQSGGGYMDLSAEL